MLKMLQLFTIANISGDSPFEKGVGGLVFDYQVLFCFLTKNIIYKG